MLRFALLLVATVWPLCVTPAVAEQNVRLMANTSPPYADAKLPEQGLALELVKHVFAATDYSPEITIENWSRAVEGAQSGCLRCAGFGLVFRRAQQGPAVQRALPAQRAYYPETARGSGNTTGPLKIWPAVAWG